MAPVRALVLVIIGAIIFRIVLANSIGGEQKFSCKGARTTIAILEQNYQRKYHHYIVGDEEALQELVRSKMTRGLMTCRAGGHYSAVANADGSITIHCSLPQHDNGSGVTRQQLRHLH